MCSIVSASDEAGPASTDLAARLARTIDELAAAASAGPDAADFAALLATAWATVAAADPQLAARTARYTRRGDVTG
jgi:hypothetical protein